MTIREFLTWWGTQLKDTVPAAVRNRLQRARTTLTLRIAEGTVFTCYHGTNLVTTQTVLALHPLQHIATEDTTPIPGARIVGEISLQPRGDSTAQPSHGPLHRLLRAQPRGELVLAEVLAREVRPRVGEERGHEGKDDPALGVLGQVPADDGQRGVLEDAADEDEPLTLAILGREADTLADGLADVPRVHTLHSNFG